jgi:uncharacterized protein (DUF58 family)
MAGTIAFNELFDPAFLDSLKHLRIASHRVARGGRYAEQKSEDLGHGLEFKDFRPYATGDDLRAIDWNIYRRLGKVFIRLFEEQQDLPMYLMPDVSKSMFLESKPRAHAGLRSAMALAAISLNQHDSVGLFPFADDLEVVVKSKSGKSGVMTFAKHLAALQSRDKTDLSLALKRFSGINVRRGLLVIISDFFDPGGIEAIKKSMRSIRHQLLLVQLVRQSDSKPDLQGDLRLRDCETGELTEVTITPELLKRYSDAYESFNQELAEFAKQRNAGLLRLDTDGDVVKQLATIFESGSLYL